jgi:hypothetical protein
LMTSMVTFMIYSLCTCIIAEIRSNVKHYMLQKLSELGEQKCGVS